MRAVLERDFLSEASRPRAVVLRTLLAAVVAASVLLLFHLGTRDLGYDPDRVGMNIFRAGTISLLLLLVILTPPLVVGSILAERQQETLPLVLASPVGPRSLALAKLLSRCAVALGIALAALPCLSLTVLFGGVSGKQILGLAVLSMALVLEMAAWSLWISSVSRRLATASVLSFVLPPARWVATGFLIAWIEHKRQSQVSPTAGAEWAMVFLADTTPFGPFVELVETGSLASAQGSTGSPLPLFGFLSSHPWFAYLAFAALAGGAAVLAAGKRLESEAEPRDSILARTKRGRRWFRGLPGAGNPMAWKEKRLLNTASSRPMFYGVMGVMALATFLASPALVDAEGTFALVACETTLLALVAAVGGAASLGAERDQGGYDLLRASLLTPGQILLGKLAGLFLGTLFLAAIPLCQLGISLAMKAIAVRSAVAAALLLVLVPTAWGLVGLWIGTGCARVRTAVVRACALFGTILVGLPCAAGVLMAVDDEMESAAAWLFSASPPVFQYFVLNSVQRLDFDFAFRTDEPWTHGLLWTMATAAVAVALRIRLPVAMARRLELDRETG